MRAFVIAGCVCAVAAALWLMLKSDGRDGLGGALPVSSAELEHGPPGVTAEVAVSGRHTVAEGRDDRSVTILGMVVDGSRAPVGKVRVEVQRVVRGVGDAMRNSQELAHAYTGADGSFAFRLAKNSGTVRVVTTGCDESGQMVSGPAGSADIATVADQVVTIVVNRAAWVDFEVINWSRGSEYAILTKALGDVEILKFSVLSQKTASCRVFPSRVGVRGEFILVPKSPEYSISRPVVVDVPMRGGAKASVSLVRALALDVQVVGAKTRSGIGSIAVEALDLSRYGATRLDNNAPVADYRAVFSGVSSRRIVFDVGEVAEIGGGVVPRLTSRAVTDERGAARVYCAAEGQRCAFRLSGRGIVCVHVFERAPASPCTLTFGSGGRGIIRGDIVPPELNQPGLQLLFVKSEDGAHGPTAKVAHDTGRFEVQVNPGKWAVEYCGYRMPFVGKVPRYVVVADGDEVDCTVDLSERAPCRIRIEVAIVNAGSLADGVALEMTGVGNLRESYGNLPLNRQPSGMFVAIADDVPAGAQKVWLRFPRVFADKQGPGRVPIIDRFDIVRGRDNHRQVRYVWSKAELLVRAEPGNRLAHIYALVEGESGYWAEGTTDINGNLTLLPGARDASVKVSLFGRIKPGLNWLDKIKARQELRQKDMTYARTVPVSQVIELSVPGSVARRWK